MTDVKPLKILRYPDAIPTTKSIRSQALWADEISAFWPDEHEPTPLTLNQEAALKDTMLVKDAGVFRPRFVNAYSLGAIDAYVAAYKTSRKSARDNLSVLTEKTRLFETFPSDVPKMSAKAAKNFLHASKLTSGMVDSLLVAGLIQPAGDPEQPYGFTAPPRFVEGLLAAIAEDEAAQEPDLTLVPSNASAARSTVNSNCGDIEHLALALQLPALPDVSSRTSVEAILNMRSSRKFERARADYLASLHELRVGIERGLGDEVTVEALQSDFLRQLRDDLHSSAVALKQTSGKVRGIRFATGVGIAQVLVSVVGAVVSPGLISMLSSGLTLAGGVVAFRATTQQLSLLRLASMKGVQFTT